MKFITFTDVHVSSINPQSRLGSYLDDILEKLDQIGRAGRKLGVDFYVLAGDLFNLKYPMRNPHSLNTVLIDLFKSYGAPVYATEGNHDLRNDSYKTFDEQPLSVLYASGALTQLRDKTVESGGVKVRLRAFPFQEEPDFKSMVRSKDNADLSIAVMHVYASPNGGMYHLSKMFSYTDLAETGDDLYVLGHLHLDQGIVTMDHHGRNLAFVNVGAVSRGSLVDDNVTRQPKIGYVEISKVARVVTKKVQAIRLTVKPSSEVFDLVSKEKERKRAEEAESFVEKLRSEDKGEDSIVRIDTELSSMGLDKAILDCVNHYLTETDMVLRGA